MKIFNKKFKVRIRHYTNAKYIVEYARYRFIPIYKPLYFWFGFYTGEWALNMWKYEQACEIAENLKSYDDIIKYYKSEFEKRDKWKKENEEWWKRNVPVTKKYF